MNGNDISEEERNKISVGDILLSREPDNKWYKAKIIEILVPGEDVKIHYLGWNQKWDKVIKLTSPSVRYKRPEIKEVKLNFKIGQKVMALFVDGNMYAAEIIGLQSDSKYNVKFYDGIIKKGLPESSIAKFSEKAKKEAESKAIKLYGQGIKQEDPIRDSPLERSKKRRNSNHSITPADTDSKTPRRSLSRSRSSSRPTTPAPKSTAEIPSIDTVPEETPIKLGSSKATPKSASRKTPRNRSKPKTPVPKVAGQENSKIIKKEVVKTELNIESVAPVAIEDPSIVVKQEVVDDKAELKLKIHNETPKAVSKSVPRKTLLRRSRNPSTEQKTPKRSTRRLSRNSSSDELVTTPVTTKSVGQRSRVSTAGVHQLETRDNETLTPSSARKGLRRSMKRLEPYEPGKNIPEPMKMEQNNDERLAEEYNFTDIPKDNVNITTSKLKPNKTKNEIKLDDLLGEGGIGKNIKVLYENKWIPAKVIAPTKTEFIPEEKSIFIHYMGWKKRYDQWIPLSSDIIQIEQPTEIKPEPFRVGQQVMGTWSDKEYYPCKILKCLEGAYSVEFYDGFKRKLSIAQVKSATQSEIKAALAKAESSFGDASNTDKSRPRKSIFKRNNGENGQNDDEIEDAKRMILGKKRKRPNSQSSASSPSQNQSVEALTTIPLVEQTKSSSKGSPALKKVKKNEEKPENPIENILSATTNEDIGTTRPRRKKDTTDKETVLETKENSATGSTKISTRKKEARNEVKLSKATIIISDPIPDKSVTTAKDSKEKRIRHTRRSANGKFISSKDIKQNATETKLPEKVASEPTTIAEEEAENPIDTQRQKEIDSLKPEQKAIFLKITGTLGPDEADIILKSFLKQNNEIDSSKSEPEKSETSEKKEKNPISKNESVSKSKAKPSADDNPIDRSKKVKAVASEKVKAPSEDQGSESEKQFTDVPPKTNVNPRPRRSTSSQSPARTEINLNSPKAQLKSTRIAELRALSPNSRAPLSRAQKANSPSQNGGVTPTRSLRNRSDSENTVEAVIEKRFQLGNLVWAKWGDTNSYGGIIFAFTRDGYKLRFALDGIEKEIKEEMVSKIWNPSENVADDFHDYFRKMLCSSDPKAVQRSLNAAKRQFDISKSDSEKNSKASNKTELEKDTKENTLQVEKLTPIKKAKEKPIRHKSLSALADKLSAAASSSAAASAEVSVVTSPDIAAKVRQPRKSQPARRSSGPSSISSPVTPTNTSETVMTRRSTKSNEVQPEKNLKLMPKSVKNKIIEDSNDGSRTLKLMPKSIKEKLKVTSEKTNENKQSDEETKSSSENTEIKKNIAVRGHDMSPMVAALSPLKTLSEIQSTMSHKHQDMTKNEISKSEGEQNDEYDSHDDGIETQQTNTRTQCGGGGDFEFLQGKKEFADCTPGKTPDNKDMIPKYEIGNHVKIESGKVATIVKVFRHKNRAPDYCLRVENGPKLKKAESDLTNVGESEFIIRPIVDHIINDALIKQERKKREQKKLDPTGIAHKIKPNSPVPLKAFTGIENEFKCLDDKCPKSFRKKRMLDSHLKHYHPELSPSPVRSNEKTPRSKTVSESTEEDVVTSAPPSSRVAESESEIDLVDTRQKVVYQCSCGWEGSEFWSQNPSGVPIRNHICQRPQKVRNVKETQMIREIYRTEDIGDYYDDFKLQVYPDEETQELVRETNLVQNEIYNKVILPSRKIRETLRQMKPVIESYTSGTNDAEDSNEFSISVAEGVSEAQNALPDTHGNDSESSEKYSDQELVVLEAVKQKEILNQIFKDSAVQVKTLDELEEYVTHMERDLDQKTLDNSLDTEVQMTMNE